MTARRRRPLGQTTEDGAVRGQDASRTLSAGRSGVLGHGYGSELEMIFANRVAMAGLPLGEVQYRFVPGRQFRFDRAWPERMVAAEVQGGTWSQRGHARPSIIQRDCLKLSMAAALGWRVLPLTREMIEDGTAIRLIAQALKGVDPSESEGV